MRAKILRAVRECPPGADMEEWLDTASFSIGSTYGGDTSCVEIRSDGHQVILDAGSGIRRLGLKMMAEGDNKRPIHILLSHFHWDHIQGLPFFVPLLIPGAEVHFYSGRTDAAELVAAQYRRPFFPLEFEVIESHVNVHHVNGTFDVEGFKISTMRLEHPDGSYGYRIDDGKSCIVNLTDVELLEAGKDALKEYREFVRGADVVIADVQYGFMDTHKKRTWGHSSIFAFVDLLVDTDVKRVVLFHHEPASSDEELDELFAKAIKYVKTQPGAKDLKVIPAYTGLEIEF